MTKLNLQEISDLLTGKTVYDDEGEEIIVDDLNYVSVSQKKFRAQYKLLKIASKYSPEAKMWRKKIQSDVILNAYAYKNMLRMNNSVYRNLWYNVDSVRYFMESEFGTQYYEFNFGFYNKVLVKSEYIELIHTMIDTKRTDIQLEKLSGKIQTRNRLFDLKHEKILELEYDIKKLNEMLNAVE